MVGSIYTWTFRGGVGSPVRSVGARAARFMIRRRRLGGIWISSSIARCCTRARRGRRVRSAACARRRRHGLARDRVSRCCLRPMCWRWPSRCRSPMRPSGSASTTRACGASSNITSGGRWRSWICRWCGASPPTRLRRGAATTTSACSHGAAQGRLRRRRQGRGDREGIRGFSRGAWRPARGGDRRQHRHGGSIRGGDQENFPNAEITFDKFHVIKLANEAGDQVRREEARNNFQIKGRRYIFLKNVDHLTQEEKEALSRLEAQNLDTIQAMQIRMNLQQLFTMSAKSARRFLARWKAWVQVCDLAPMKKLAKTITAKSEGILRSIATGLSNGVIEAINGNVQAAKRKAKGYRTKRNLKAIVYLIAGDVLANSPI